MTLFLQQLLSLKPLWNLDLHVLNIITNDLLLCVCVNLACFDPKHDRFEWFAFGLLVYVVSIIQSVIDLSQ